MMRLALWIVLLVASLAAGGAAHADDESDAQKAYVDGQKRFDDDDYAGALTLFEKALSVTKSPNARLYVARCLAELGRTVEAYEQMKQTLDDAKQRATSEAKYVRTRDASAAELVQLEARVGRVVVALPDDSSEAEVTIAGAPLARERIGKPVAVEPGEIEVEARMAGRAPVKKSVTVAAGALVTVALQLDPLAEGEAVPVAAPTSAPERRDDPGFGAVRAAGIAVLGLGVAGLVVMGVTGAMAQDRLDQLEEECGGVRCTDPNKADLVDEGETLRNVSNAMIAVGGAATAAGVLMIIFGGPKDSESAALRVDPRGVSLTGRF